MIKKRKVASQYAKPKPPTEHHMQADAVKSKTMVGKCFNSCIFALLLAGSCLCFVMMNEMKMMQSEAPTEKNDSEQILVEQSFQAETDVVLEPPYRIALFGETRTGSTFMQQLLYAIVRIKTPPEENVRIMMRQVAPGNFVSKCHVAEGCQKLLDLVEKDEVSVFISTRDRENVKFSKTEGKENEQLNKIIASRALHMQETVNLYNCSLCEVDAYKHIFNLTDAEIQRVKDYMATYEIIRTCCGRQMSRWERLRLHGCDITEEDRARPDFKQCDHINKTQVELKMASDPGGIKYAGMHPKFNWMEVGDCEKFDREVMSGKDFTKNKFETSAETCNELKMNPNLYG